jgi:flavin-binding protein dodecin
VSRGIHRRHIIHLQEHAMTVAKVIELNASSTKSMEDAVQTGLTKCAESVKNIKGAWVNEIKVVTGDDGSIKEWRVNLRVTFIVK